MAITVVTLRLSTEPWQADIINKRLELCRKIYNNMLHEKLHQWNQMSHLPEYIACRKTIEEAYKSEDKNAKKNDDYILAVKTLNDLYENYHFTKYGLHRDYPRFREVYKTNISSVICQRSVSNPLWSAFEKKLLKPSTIVHYKRFDDFNTITSDGRSGLRIVDETGKTCLCADKKERLWLSFSAQRGKEIRVPIIMPKDEYKRTLLSQRIKEVTLCRETYKSKYAYVVKIAVDSPAVLIKDRHSGEIKHPTQSGPVGIYIDTETVTIHDANHEVQFGLEDISTKSPLLYEEERGNLSRKMDRSRRVNNPDNYLPDGKVKNGIYDPQSRQRTKLKWSNSKAYETTRMLLKDNHRKAKETKKVYHGWLSNYILSLGDTICINDYAFQQVAQRKKFEEGDENYPNGPSKKKKQKGHIINLYSPATLIRTLDNKLARLGKPEIQKIKLEKIDYEQDEYRQYYANQLFEFASARMKESG